MECGSGVHSFRSGSTGKERDTESGLDYFEARYYSSAMGRFMSPDWSAKEEPVPYATMDDPQSLNLYSYVRNNPLSRTDPDGHCDSNGQNCSAWDHIAGAIGGALNIIPATLNLPNQAFNAISGAFNGPQIELIPMIQADAHASQTGIDVGTAAATAVPVAAAAAEAKTAGMVVGEVRAATAAEAVPESIPAGPGARPSPTQQGAINEMGDAHGCSTCGATSPGTKTGNWVGDHQPPTKLNPTGGPQVYKPQCLQCSRQQGGQVAAAVKAAKKTTTPQ
jgi:RHS repeat-associated protein